MRRHPDTAELRYATPALRRAEAWEVGEPSDLQAEALAEQLAGSAGGAGGGDGAPAAGWSPLDGGGDPDEVVTSTVDAMGNPLGEPMRVATSRFLEDDD